MYHCLYLHPDFYLYLYFYIYLYRYPYPNVYLTLHTICQNGVNTVLCFYQIKAGAKWSLFAESIFNDFPYKNMKLNLLKFVPEISWESNSVDVF